MNAILGLPEADLYMVQDFKKAQKVGVPIVSLTKPSLFYFKVSCDTHYGAAEILVTPTRSGNNQNFIPALRYSCCACASSELVKAECQEVYDNCIRPIQWIFRVFRRERYEKMYSAMSLAKCDSQLRQFPIRTKPLAMRGGSEAGSSETPRNMWILGSREKV
jgi:hypothetical protein